VIAMQDNFLNSNSTNKSEIVAALKNKLEYLLSEKIYFLKANIEFLDDWMFSAIQSGDKNIRQTVKWYYSMHIDELDETILNFIKEIDNKNVDEDELNKEFYKLLQIKDRYKNEVIQIYKLILNRRPDHSELLHYSNMLKYEIIDAEKIEEILKNSDDYKRGIKYTNKVNNISIVSDIGNIARNHIDYGDNKDEYYTNIISKAYQEVLQRNENDNGLYVDSDGLKTYLPLMRNGMTEDKLRNILRNSQEYKDNFGIYRPETKAEIETKLVRTGNDQRVQSTSSRLKLTYCMMGTNRLEEIKPYIETVIPYVDKFIFIDGGSEDETVGYLKSLNKDKEEKIDVYTYPWQDRFSGQRNNYLRKLKERNYDGWVIVSDSDEHYPVGSLRRIRSLIPEIAAKGYNGIQVQVIDITVDDKDFNKIIDSNKNDYWKALIFKYDPNLRYEGEPHETLVGIPIKWFKSTKDDIFYEHRRSKRHILERATENYFISNSNRYSERWAEFRYLCTINNILNFKEYWKLFQKHELPKDIEEWIYKHKDDNQDSGDSELREMNILYFDIIPKLIRSTVNDEKELVELVSESKLSTTINNTKEKLRDDIIKLLLEFKQSTGLSVKHFNMDDEGIVKSFSME